MFPHSESPSADSCLVKHRLILVAALAVLLAGETRLRAQEELAESAPPYRRVYVPLEELDVLLERSDKGVLLPREEFEKLRTAAEANTSSVPSSAADALISGIRYEGRIAGDQLLLRATLDITHFVPGWTAVHLPFEGWSVEKATFDEEPARIGRQEGDKPGLQLFSRDAGKRQLVLELSRPLDAAGSDRFATLSLIPSPSAELSFEVPAGKSLQVDGLSIPRPAPEDQPATYTLPVGGRSQVTLRITQKSTGELSQSLVFARTAAGVRVEAQELTWHALTSLHVYGPGVDQITLRLPGWFQIVAINSPGLASWEPLAEQSDELETTLRLTWRQAVQGERKITFQAIAATEPDELWSVPNLTVVGAVAHTGRVAITAAAGLRLRLEEADGTSRIPPQQLPQEIRSRLDVSKAMYFALLREDFTLAFATVPKSREVHAAISTLLDVNSRGLDLMSTVTARSRFEGLFELDFSLPAEWTVTSVTRDGRNVAWQNIPQEAGVHRIRIPFDPPVPAETPVTLLLQAHRDPEHWPIEEEPVEIALPELALAETDILEGTYTLTADRELEIVPVQISGLDPARISSATQTRGEGTRLEYAYQDTRFNGQLRISRAPTRVAATTQQYHRLERETLQTHLDLLIDIEGGGRRSIEIALPEAAGTNLQFELVDSPVRLIEQTAAEPENGERVWTLRFDQRARGTLRVVADLEVPRSRAATVPQAAVEPVEMPEADEAAVKDAAEKNAADAPKSTPPETRYTFPSVRVIGAERQSGFIALEAAPNQRLEIEALGGNAAPLQEIDPIELAPSLFYQPRERIVAAYAYVRPGYRVTLNEHRFDRISVPTAVSRQLTMTSILDAKGELQHEAIYRFSAVGVQSLRVVLPEGGTLWSVLLDGEPVEVRSVEGASLVTLPPGSQPLAERTLRLLYRSATEPLTGTGRFQQQPPRITVVDGEGREQTLPILEQSWTIHHPADTVLLETREEFQRDGIIRGASWFALWRELLGRDAPQTLAVKFWGLVIAALFLWVLALGFRRWGWLGIFVSLAVSCVLLVIIGVAFLSSRASTAKFVAGLEATTAPAAAEAPSADQSDFEFREDSAKVFFENGRAGNRDLRMPVPQEEQAPHPSAAPSQPMPARKPADQPAGPAGKDAFSPPTTTPAARTGAEAAAPVVQQPTPAPQAAGQAAPVQRRGLLSIAIELQPPPGSRTAHFTYIGTAGAAESPRLDVRYQQADWLRRAVFVIAAIVILLFWILRNARSRSRWWLAVVTLTIPLAFLSIASPVWLPYLEGVWLGALAGLLLWGVTSILRRLERSLQPRSSSAMRAAAVAFLLFTLGTQGTINAQEPVPAGNKGPQNPVLPILAAEDAAAETVIVPYEAGTDPLESERIFLPQEQFRRLWLRAHPEDRPQAAAPLSAVVAEALYHAELEPARKGTPAAVAVTARFALFNLQETQSTVELPLGSVAVREALLDGKPASLIANAGAATPLAVVLPAAGLHLLDLKFSVPARTAESVGEFSLPLRAVATGALRFVLPQPDLTVRAEGGRATFRRVEEKERQLLLVPIDRGGETTIKWQPAQQRGEAEAIVHVETTSALLVEEIGVRLNVAMTYRVRQGGLSRVSIALPTGVLVREIRGADVGGWELQEDEDPRKLVVFLRRPVEDETTLQFDLYAGRIRDTGEQRFSLPAFAPQDITRETGSVAVFTEASLLARVQATEGLSQINASRFEGTRLAERPSGDLQAAYTFSRRPIQLELLVRRREPQALVSAEHAVRIEPRRQILRSELQFELTEAPRSELAFLIPSGYIVQSLEGDDIADWFVDEMEDEDEEAGKILRVELASSRTGRLALVLVGTRPRDPGEAEASLQLPEPQQVDELKTLVTVSLAPLYRGNFGDLDVWRSVDPAEQRGQTRSPAPQPVQLAFRAETTELPPLAIQLTRAEPRLHAAALSIVTVDRAAIEHALALDWQISLASADTFVFTAPDWLAGRLDFQASGGPRIRQVLEEPAGAGRRRWTILLEEPRQDRYFVVARATLPPPADDLVRAPAIVFEQPAIGGDPAVLETQSQYAVVINEAQSLLVPRNPAAVEVVDASEVRGSIEFGTELLERAAEIVRLRAPGAEAIWQIQRAQTQRLLPATVNLADQITVLARDGTYRSRMRYTIRNRSRQFLGVRMPADSRILSLMVQREAARPVATTRNGQPIHLIPLPKTVEGDLSFDVDLVFSGSLSTGSLPRSFWSWRQKVELPSPVVLSQADDAEFGVPVARTTWTVYLPEDYDVEVLDDGHTNVTPVSATMQEYERRASLLAEIAELMRTNRSALSSEAQSRALLNLKQLGVKIHNFNEGLAPPGKGVTAREAPRQKGIALEAEKLSREIEELERKNAEEGLIVVTDGSGSLQVVDERRRFTQDELVRELYSRNTISLPAQDDAESLELKMLSDESRVRRDLSNGQLPRQLLREQAKAQAVQQEQVQRARQQQVAPRPTPSHATAPFSGLGGIGGAGEGQFPSNFAQPDAAAAAREFAATAGSVSFASSGGLSLPIEIPVRGQRLSFVKVGGEARLSLGVWPDETLRMSLGLLWTIAWLAVLVGVLIAIGRSSTGRSVWRMLPFLLATIGIVWFLIFPLKSEAAWIGAGLFLVGGISLALNRRPRN